MEAKNESEVTGGAHMLKYVFGVIESTMVLRMGAGWDFKGILLSNFLAVMGKET